MLEKLLILAIALFLGTLANLSQSEESKSQEVTIPQTKNTEVLTALLASANGGNAKAQYNMGMRYFWNNGVPKDDDQAFSWVSKSAFQGYELAQYSLGVMYKTGQGTSQNTKAANLWIKRGLKKIFFNAKNGDVTDQMWLASKYYYGSNDFLKNLEKSFQWTKLAAQQGNREAQYNLALNYLNGEGIPKNLQQALEWLEKSATQGHPPAEYRLAQIYANGELSLLKDKRKAFEWYEKAATQTEWESVDFFAQKELADMYDQGDGIPQNKQKAAEWYKKSWDHGNSTALIKLAQMNFEGDGIPIDLNQALIYAKRGLTAGFTQTEASELLADIYIKQENYLMAYMWLNMITASYHNFEPPIMHIDGTENYQEKRIKQKDLIAKRLLPEQITQAQQKSTECFNSKFTNCD